MENVMKLNKYKRSIQSSNKEKVKSERNSSIELLKIISILIIVISHTVPFGDYFTHYFNGYLNLNMASSNIQHIILVLFRYLGNIGNVIFIICSSYFLIDSKKINIRKVTYILIDSFTISIIFLLICLLLKYDVSSLAMLRAFFPITFKNNWFVGCYLLFYIIHPFLNIIIKM